MSCPKCVGKLQEKNIEDYKVDVCFICEGLWFDAGELEKVIEADAKDFKFIDVDREELDRKEIVDFKEELDKTECKCLRCNDGINPIRKEHEGMHKVNVDVCPKCNGIWLDGGEIKELRQRRLVELKDKIDSQISFLKYIFLFMDSVLLYKMYFVEADSSKH
jgi:Zn-finger nucleic acid-binding protein